MWCPSDGNAGLFSKSCKGTELELEFGETGWIKRIGGGITCDNSRDRWPSGDGGGGAKGDLTSGSALANSKSVGGGWGGGGGG